MHELSIVMSVLDTTLEIAQTHQAVRVAKIRLKVGELSSVDPDALDFAFTAAREGHPLFSGTELEVEWVPIRVYCPSCQAEGPAATRSVVCAGCGNRLTRVVGGEELDIATVELEQAQVEQAEVEQAEGHEHGKPDSSRTQSPVQE